LTIGQAADYCGIDRAEVYHKMLRDLEVRRIGVRGASDNPGYDVDAHPQRR